MSSSSSAKKRKTDNNANVSDGGQADRSAPALRVDAKKPADDDGLHLPPPVWGHVLDFMPYQEVRSALLLCKMIANEAVKYAHTLNIMKVHQMDGPATRRFPNVEEVNCFSLISTDSSDDRERPICAKTAARLVPFLVCIPNLQRVFAGGWRKRNERRFTQRRVYFYRDDYDAGDESGVNLTLFVSLVRTFLGAFQGRLFPYLEELSGISDAWDDIDICDHTATDDICSGCKDICMYFPVKDLIENADLEDFVTKCGKDPVRIYELIAQRPHPKELFRAASERKLFGVVLHSRLMRYTIRKNRKEGKKLLEKLRTQHDVDTDAYGFHHVQFLKNAGLSQLDRMIDLGFDPRVIPKKEINIRFGIGGVGRYADVFAKSTVDALIARGFNLDPKELIILDEGTEPALKKELPDLIRKED